MSLILKNKTDLIVPIRVRRQAGIKAGDRVEFKASSRTITITAVGPPAYKPTKVEMAAIRKGEAEIARGEFVNLPDLLHDMDRHRRKGGTKAARKVSR